MRAQVVKGIVEGCKQSDCTLLGGEVTCRLASPVKVTHAWTAQAASALDAKLGPLLLLAASPVCRAMNQPHVFGLSFGGLLVEPYWLHRK